MNWAVGKWSVTCRLERRGETAPPYRVGTLALLAHELRNPLAAASNAVHLLRLRGLTAGQERPVQILETALEQTSALIDDMTDVSRLAAGQVRLRYVSVDLATLLRDLLLPFETLAARKSLDLVIQLPSVPLRVFGDPLRLAQVFNNLVGNALKYTDRGRVWVTAAPADGSAWVAIKDTGVGLDPTTARHLFQPFVQREERGGMGLGLFVARGFVELHGGAITAASDGPGCGTLVTLELPLESGLRATERKVDVSANPEQVV